MNPAVLARRFTLWFALALSLAALAKSLPRFGLAAVPQVALLVGIMLLPVAVPGWLAGRAPARWQWAHLAVQLAGVAAMVYAIWAMTVHPDAQQGIALMLWVVGLLLSALTWLLQSLAARFG